MQGYRKCERGIDDAIGVEDGESGLYVQRTPHRVLILDARQSLLPFWRNRV